MTSFLVMQKLLVLICPANMGQCFILPLQFKLVVADISHSSQQNATDVNGRLFHHLLLP